MMYFLAPLGTVIAILGAVLLPLQHNRFIWSYVIAIAVCMSAAAGIGSPFYEVFRAALPGFDRLRLLSPFLFVTVVPCGVLLAASIEAGMQAPPTRDRTIACVLILAGAGALVALAQPLRASSSFYLVASAGVLGASVGAIAFARRTRRVQAALAIVLAVLVGESLLLKSSYLRGFPEAVLEEAEPLAEFLRDQLRSDPGARIAHLNSRPSRELHNLVLYTHWNSPGYEIAVRASIARLMPNTNALYEIPTLDASDALPLSGVPQMREIVVSELKGLSGSAAGLRWIDRLHIRYVIADAGAKMRAPDLHPIWTDPAGNVQVLENPSAGAAWSAPAEGALPLAVAPANGDHEPSALRESRGGFAAPWLETAVMALPFVQPIFAGPTEVENVVAGPLYVPIASYPGWSAWIDGVRVEIRPDTQFGMWIDAPVGRHRLELRFVPNSFYVGAVVSVTTLSGVAIFSVLWRRRFTTDRQQRHPDR
jgi:hypothetical protein